MRDPYLFEDSFVLKNKLNIRDPELLEQAEADYVVFRLKDIALNPLKGDYHTDHFLKMHEYIFQDIYEWAGEPRTISIYKEEDVLGGLSVEYSDPFDIVNDLHHALNEMRSKKWTRMDKSELSKEICDSIAKIWRIHPFREGNTRTTITFCCQYFDEQRINLDRKLFEDNARYVRTALVAYNAYFANGEDYSKKEYFERIVFDSIR